MHPLLENNTLVIPQTVAWGEMDAFNHVNNTVYFRYFENIRMIHFEDLGLMKIMQADNVGPILAETRCRFKAPLSYPDTLHIGVTVKNLGEDHFTHSYTIVSDKLNRVVAEGEGKIIYYDYQKNCRAKFSNSLFEKLQVQANDL